MQSTIITVLHYSAVYKYLLMDIYGYFITCSERRFVDDDYRWPIGLHDDALPCQLLQDTGVADVADDDDDDDDDDDMDDSSFHSPQIEYQVRIV